MFPCFHLNPKIRSCTINPILSVESTSSHSPFFSNPIRCSNNHQIVIRSFRIRKFNTKRHLIIPFPLINFPKKTSSLSISLSNNSNHNPHNYPCLYLNSSPNKHRIHPTALPILAMINRRSCIPGVISPLKEFLCKLFARSSKDSISPSLESSLMSKL